jgi:hypothetical protein
VMPAGATDKESETLCSTVQWESMALAESEREMVRQSVAHTYVCVYIYV